MSTGKRRALWAWIAGVALFCFFLLWAFRAHLVGGAVVGEPLPGFVLYTLEGEPVSLESWRGKPLVLRLSSVGCTACADDFALLERLQSELGEEAVVVAVQVGDTAAGVRAALRGRQVKVPVLLDPAGDAANALGLRFVPGVYFVTSRGTLSSAATTELSRIDVASHVRLMLAGGPDLADEVKRVSQKIRCRECEGRSIWESDAPTSIEMRRQVRDLLLAGMRGEEILAAFERQYGEWILLAPPVRGIAAMVWVLPAVAVGGGFLAWGRFLARSKKLQQAAADQGEEAADDAERAELVRRIDEYLP